MRLAIVADDLTGAMDTGVQFAKGGLHTLILLAGDDLPLAEAVVTSTDSRNEAAKTAYTRVKEVARRLKGRAVYKKIDSTLRGNLGPEIDGLLDGLGLKHALVAPAFPAMGRTTENGYHRVNGVPISETAFANDPFWPITESYIPALLSRQTRRSVGHLPLSIVEQGEEAVRRALEVEQADIVVADAVEPVHLRSLARALASLWESWLPCGSAGLAEEWPRALGIQMQGDASPIWAPRSDPVLVIAGSRNPSTAQQLQRAAHESGLELIEPSAGGEWMVDSLHKAAYLLLQGRNVALTTTFSEYREGQGNDVAAGLAGAAKEVIALLQRQPLFDRGQDAHTGSRQRENVAATFRLRVSRGVTFRLTKRRAQAEACGYIEGTGQQSAHQGTGCAPIAGLFMTGGDIARAVCRVLGATALRALGEVQPGIPAGLLVGGHLDGTRVVTKAGGFGDDLSIVRSIQYLQGQTT